MENDTAHRGLVVVERVRFASGSRDATLGPRSLVRAMRPSTKACGSRRRLKRQSSSACLALVIGPNSNSVLRPKRAPCRPKMQSNYQIQLNNKKIAWPATKHLSALCLFDALQYLYRSKLVVRHQFSIWLEHSACPCSACNVCAFIIHTLEPPLSQSLPPKFLSSSYF